MTSINDRNKARRRKLYVKPAGVATPIDIAPVPLIDISAQMQEQWGDGRGVVGDKGVSQEPVKSIEAVFTHREANVIAQENDKLEPWPTPPDYVERPKLWKSVWVAGACTAVVFAVVALGWAGKL